MRKTVENIWDILNDFQELVEYGYKTGFRKKYINTCSSESLKTSNEADSLIKIADEINICRKCRLCEKRKMCVPGSGSHNPFVMIIGEAPGRDEDLSGIPFIGAAGKYLDTWLNAINLDRNTNCFICNIVKCRPPGNRDPEKDEISICLPFLERQIELLKPSVILTLGRIAGRVITKQEVGIGRMRGRIYSYKGIPVIPTYHPSAVLRDKDRYRRPVWEDLKMLRAELDKNGK